MSKFTIEQENEHILKRNIRTELVEHCMASFQTTVTALYFIQHQ